MYGISHVQIGKDINHIVRNIDPDEINKGFTEYLTHDKKATILLKNIIDNPNIKIDMRMKAIETMLKVQDQYTRLLEAFGKKQKAVDRVQVESVNYHVTIDKPYEDIKNVKGIKNKLDTDKEAVGSVENP